MLRKATQLLLLPVLFAIFAAGGKVTLCEVLSTVGLEAHHHAYHGSEEGAPHPGPFCSDSHEREGQDHHHEKVPCPESCEIQLSEAPAPVLLKVPTMPEGHAPPYLLEVLLATEVPDTLFRAIGMLEPPDLAAPLTDPMFTGRFLV